MTGVKVLEETTQHCIYICIIVTKKNGQISTCFVCEGWVNCLVTIYMVSSHASGELLLGLYNMAARLDLFFK